MLNLFVTSLKKGEGKTFISAGLAATMQSLDYKSSVYKPIQVNCAEKDGFLQSKELVFVKSVEPYVSTYFTYMFNKNAEPLIASEFGNEYIDTDLILKEYRDIISLSECNLVEGIGGLLTPLNPNEQNYHLIKKMQIPLLFVITPTEDCINDILMSINFATEKNIKVRGVIINNITDDCSKIVVNSIPRLIEEYSNAKILGIIPRLENTAPHEIISNVLNGIDIESVFDIRIEKLRFN